MRTFFSILLMIIDLDFLKSWLSLLVYLKGVSGWSNWRNGSIRLLVVKV